MAKSAGQHNNVALRDVTMAFWPDKSRFVRAPSGLQEKMKVLSWWHLLKMADISRAPTADAPDSAFALLLPPGRYRLEFQSSEGNGPFKRKSHLIEVKTARWSDHVMHWREARAIPFMPCPILP